MKSIGEILEEANLPVDVKDKQELKQILKNYSPEGCRFSNKCAEGYIQEWDDEKEMWSVVRECKCKKIERRRSEQRERITTIAGNQIPKMWRQKGGFDTFNRDEQPKAFDVCKRYVDKYEEKIEREGMWVYLYGPVGVGKTHLVYSILEKLQSDDIPSLMIKADQFIKETRPGGDQSLVDLAFEVEFLAIDDFMRHRTDTDHVIDTFSNLIDSRYENLRPTLITSNVAVDGIASEGGVDRWAPIEDRIIERSASVEMKGESHRVKTDE